MSFVVSFITLGQRTLYYLTRCAWGLLLLIILRYQNDNKQVKTAFAQVDAEILNSLKDGLKRRDFKREALKKIDSACFVGWPSTCGSG